jgi:hypothetical protein
MFSKTFAKIKEWYAGNFLAKGVSHLTGHLGTLIAGTGAIDPAILNPWLSQTEQVILGLALYGLRLLLKPVEAKVK